MREAYRKALPYLVFIDRPRQASQEEMRKQSVLDNLNLLFKDQPEKLAQFKNLVMKAKTMREIDETLTEIGNST